MTEHKDKILSDIGALTHQIKVNGLFQRAAQLYQQGHMEEAENLARQVLKEQPDHADGNHLLGHIATQQGQYSRACRLLANAISINPGQSSYYLHYGIALHKDGNNEDALAALRKASEIKPDFPEAHYYQGLVLHNLGNAYLTQGKHDDALAHYQMALQLNPELADTHNNLGHLYLEQSKYELARSCFEKAISLRPDFAEAHYNLGETLQRSGNTVEAIMSFQKALSIRPAFMAAKWGALLSLPILYDSTEQIEEARNRWIDGVKELLATLDLGSANSIAAAKDATSRYINFFLNYQGHLDLEEQILYGKLLTRIAQAAYPYLLESTTHHRHDKKSRIRVGFVSSFFCRHSIFKTHGHWITKLNKKDFHVSVFHAGARKDSATEEIFSHADHFCMTQNIDELIASIAEQNLDILIYTDLGMEARLQLAAALRLAPVQCNGGGHPVTSGLPTIDYFLSSDLMEPADSSSHYTETLVRLPNLASSYPYPDIEKARTPPGATRSGNEVVYLNVQSLFKLLPQHDDVYPKIAMQVPGSKFWFIGGNTETITEHFQGRLRKAFHIHGMDADKFCIMHPQMHQHEFFGLVKSADIILDGITWSGNNSSLEALAFDKPIVTIPGISFRDRHSYGILKRIDVTETVANTLDNYVAIAVKLGTNTALRKKVAARIVNNKHLAYEDKMVISGLEKFLKSAS